MPTTEKPFNKECRKTFNLHYCNPLCHEVLVYAYAQFEVFATERFLEVAIESWPVRNGSV